MWDPAAESPSPVSSVSVQSAAIVQIVVCQQSNRITFHSAKTNNKHSLHDRLFLSSPILDMSVGARALIYN